MQNASQEIGSARPAWRELSTKNINEIAALIEFLPVAVYLCGKTGKLLHYNHKASQLCGWRDNAALAKQLCCGARGEADGDEGLPLEETPTAVVIRTGKPVQDYEFVLDRPDGTSVVLLANAAPICEADGTIAGVIGSLQDVTELRRAAFQQRTLLNELNHRVKNTLATVQLLAGQTIRKCGLPKDVQDDFEARLVALSRAHDHLTREGWEPVDLRTIVRQAVEPYREPSSEMLRLRGEQIKVGAQASLTLAMIFHELANNAAKFGALSSADGRLAVSWTVANEVRTPTLVIDWEESGGPPVSAPERLGFGSRLLQQGITRQFRGTTRLDYDPSGLRCRMEIPLPSSPE